MTISGSCTSRRCFLPLSLFHLDQQPRAWVGARHAPWRDLGKPSGRLPMLNVVREVIWFRGPPKQLLCNHWRPACRKPHIHRCGFMAPVEIEQFFDAFSLDPKRPWRTAACQALGIPAGHIAEDTHINHSEGSKKSRSPQDAYLLSDGQLQRKAGLMWSWMMARIVDQVLIVDGRGFLTTHLLIQKAPYWRPPVASDQDRFDAAYEAFRDLSEGFYDIDTRQMLGGSLVTTHLASCWVMARRSYANWFTWRNWPLARLAIPLGGLSKQVDRLLEGHCFQILATNSVPDAHHGKVIQTATHLTLTLAEYLAATIAWLMRSILDHESKILFDTDTEPLLTPGFWILPLYRELLNSASRNRPSAASERARGSTGLVKIICKENKEQRGKRKYHDGTPHPKDRGGFTRLINTSWTQSPFHASRHQKELSSVRIGQRM